MKEIAWNEFSIYKPQKNIPYVLFIVEGNIYSGNYNTYQCAFYAQIGMYIEKFKNVDYWIDISDIPKPPKDIHEKKQ